MKKIVYTLLVAAFGLLSFSHDTAAQTINPVSIDSMPMSKGRFPAYMIVLNSANLDDVEKMLKDKYKEYKPKTSGDAKTEVFFDNASIKALSDNTVDVYVRLIRISQDVKVEVFFDLGGIYLSPKTHPAKSKVAEQMVTDFATKYEYYRVEQELIAAESMLSEKEKEHESHVKEKEKMEKSISSSERNIEKSRQEIAANDMKQQRKRAEIEAQKDGIVKMSGTLGDEKKVAEKTLKSLEKDLEKLEKEETNLHKSIEGEQSSIEENKRNIEKNLGDQKEKQREVEQQKSAVQDIKTRLMSIPKVD
jgi:hypothetical protein